MHSVRDSMRSLMFPGAVRVFPAAFLLACAFTAAGAQFSPPSVPAPTTPQVPTAPTSVSDAQTDINNAKKAADELKKSKKDKDKDQDKEEPKSNEPAKPGTVGATLNDLMAQVNAAAVKAAAAGNSAGMEASRDLAVAISSTQNVYEDELGRQTDGKVTAALKSAIDQLVDAILQLNTMTSVSLQVASTDAEQVTNSLPYRQGEPKIVRMTPRFLVPSSKDSYVVKVHFTGKFDMGTKPDYFASLLIHDHTYKPVASSATDVEFGVPITDLFPPRTRYGQMQVMTAMLKVPWQYNSLMGKKHTKKEDEFKILALALPSSPGTLKFMSKSTRMQQGAPQLHTGIQNYQCSGRTCGKPDDINHMWTEPPDPNCAVVPGSSTLEVSKSTGDFTKEFLGDAGEGVSYTVTTERKGTGTSSVNFTINFQETCAKEVPNTVGDTIDLTWGDTKTVKLPGGSQWKVSLDAFDGTHADFTKTDSSNPFVKVIAAPDAVTVTTPPPGTVVWPQAPAQ
ncbi:MAG TPA: hypothetical protein VGN16_08480 [Acidobacteriaceae bacterium]